MLNINFLGLALPDKAQKIVKFSFLAFSANFFFFFVLKTCGTLKMVLLSAQNPKQFEYQIEFICKRLREV